ncbi:MAG: hypothetical protein JNK65_05830, partial [Deltaproteobacteria bacterium]|nr:hypothetical protein [Deltaproteobacteria bacterium]
MSSILKKPILDLPSSVRRGLGVVDSTTQTLSAIYPTTPPLNEVVPQWDTKGRGNIFFQKSLLSWYHKHKRDLPWRKTKDPYAIWVSEIMLQQTQVATVIDYYLRFLKRFPSIQDLADAPESDVLSLWSGLGYYSRARNLQKAAQKIVLEHAGVFPQDPEQILKLPGIGPYTRGAIGSIAFDLPLALVDGNVIRVYARLNAWRGVPNDPIFQKKIW